MQPKPAHLSQRIIAILLLCLLLLQSCYQGPIITPQVPKPESNQEGKGYVSSIARESDESEDLEAKDMSWTESQGTAAVLEALPQNTQALGLATNVSSQAHITVADKPLDPLASLPNFTPNTRSHLQSPSIQSSTPIREEYLQDSRKTAAQNRTNIGHNLPSSINNTSVLLLNTQAIAKRKGSSTNVSKPNKPKLAPAIEQQLVHRKKRAAQNRTKSGHSLSVKKDQADVLNKPLNWRSREGHILLELYEAQGSLCARVADKFSSQLTYDLPVTVFPGISLSELASYSVIKLQQYLHIQLSKAPVLGQVIFSQGGLSGGVKGHKKGKATDEESKEEESSKEEETEIGVVENPIVEGDKYLQLQAENEGLVKEVQAYQEKLKQTIEALKEKEDEKLAQEAYNKELKKDSDKQEVDFKKLKEEKVIQETAYEKLQTAYEKLQEESNSKLAQKKENFERLAAEMLTQGMQLNESNSKLAQQEADFEQLKAAKLAQETAYEAAYENLQDKLDKQEATLKKLLEKEKLAEEIQRISNLMQEVACNQEKLDETIKVLAPHGEAIVNALTKYNGNSFWSNGNEFTEADMAVLVNHPGFQNLTQINLSNLKISELSLKILAPNLKWLKNLQFLYLNDNQIGDAGMQALAPNLKELTNLQSLELGNNQIGDAGVQAFGQNLKGLTNLQSLGLYNNQIGDAGVQALAPKLKALTKLQQLYLQNNQIGAAGMQALSQNLKELTNLQHLYLNHNQIGVAGIQALSENLKGLTNLLVLSLDNNQIGGICMQAFGQHLKELTNLNYLFLRNNQMGDADMQALAPNLKELTNLQQLGLDNNQIGDVGMRALGQNLKELTKLQFLYLNDNQIGDVGMQALAPNLKKLTNLQQLNLNNNQIGDASMQALGENLKGLMKELTSLLSLYLENNQIGDIGAKVLAQHLQEVKGRGGYNYIYLGKNNISTETQAWLKQQCPGMTWYF
jgi:Leucine-rich repeat (LRR) protein